MDKMWEGLGAENEYDKIYCIKSKKDKQNHYLKKKTFIGMPKLANNVLAVNK